MKSNLIGGTLVLAIGALIAAAALGSPLGTSAEMGPGFFPLALSIILIALGVAVIFIGSSDADIAGFPWKGTALVASAPLIFLATVQLLGIAISVFVVSVISSFASRQARLGPTLVFSAALGIACTLIFSFGLHLDLPILGSLFTGL